MANKHPSHEAGYTINKSHYQDGIRVIEGVTLHEISTLPKQIDSSTIKTQFAEGYLFDPYIGRGAKRKMYTLRANRKYLEDGVSLSEDIHVTNLGKDSDEARAKALELTGWNLPVDESNHPIYNDPAILTFGKHKGKKVNEAMQEDPNYLIRLVTQGLYISKTNDKKIRKIVKQQQSERNQEMIQAFGVGWLEKNAMSGYGFLQSVCWQVLSGYLLTPKQLEPLIKVRCKYKGAEGSEAFQAEYNRLQQLSKSFELLSKPYSTESGNQ